MYTDGCVWESLRQGTYKFLAQGQLINVNVFLSPPSPPLLLKILYVSNYFMPSNGLYQLLLQLNWPLATNGNLLVRNLGFWRAFFVLMIFHKTLIINFKILRVMRKKKLSWAQKKTEEMGLSSENKEGCKEAWEMLERSQAQLCSWEHPTPLLPCGDPSRQSPIISLFYIGPHSLLCPGLCVPLNTWQSTT